MLSLRKLRYFWLRWEIPNNKYEEFWAKEFTPIALLMPIGFAIVGPLSILGMILCRQRAKDLFPLWGFVIVYMFSVVAFFVTARYRIPVVPVLILFATSAVFWTVEAFRQRQTEQLRAAAVILFFAA